LSKYEKEWHELKRQEIEWAFYIFVKIILIIVRSQDPLERAQVSFFIINCSNLSRFLQRESQGLKEQILRLERENDYLARELG